MDLPIAQVVIAAVESAHGPVVKLPTLGGSVPLDVIEQALGTHTIAVPIANYDDNQHAANENIRLENLWDGIETMAALEAMDQQPSAGGYGLLPHRVDRCRPGRDRRNGEPCGRRSTVALRVGECDGGGRRVGNRPSRASDSPTAPERFASLDSRRACTVFTHARSPSRRSTRRSRSMPRMTSIQLSLAPTGFVRPRRTVEGARSEADTRDRDCVSTGVPQSSDCAERAIVFSALNASVGRFRLLRAAYPFRYQLERRFTTVSKGKELLQSMDTVTVDSRAWNSYKPGHLFTVTPGTNLLGGHYHEDVYVPSVQDLADSTFKAAHCYGYGGADTADGAAAVRIDFRPRSSFQFPDVSGSIYLDATRGFIRRVVFRVTHADLAPVPIIALSASTTFRDIAPSVQVLDRLESVEWLDATGDSRRVEQDRFLTYMFLYGAPGSQ